jgi:galactokinase
MSTTIDGDIPLVVSPSEDGGDRVRVNNAKALFKKGEFFISREVERFQSAPWTGDSTRGIPDNWEWRSRIYPCYGRVRGDYLNYLLAPYLRAAYEWPGVHLRGCDMTLGPSTIPLRAGTSSSSAVVVLALLALILTNRDRLPSLGIRNLCRFLGEAEWYVGTRGGANDQTTIFRNQANSILYNLHHLDLIDSRPLPWLKGMEVILCNSLWEADKALGARYIFNLRKGWMDLGRDLLEHLIRRATLYLDQGGETDPGWLTRLLGGFFPDDRVPEMERLERRPETWKILSERFRHLGSLDQELLGLEEPVIDELIRLLPENITPEAAGRILSKSRSDLERDYTLPRPEDGGYRPRQAALFFSQENRIGRALEGTLLEAHARLARGEIQVESREYEVYRDRVAALLNELQAALRDVFQVSSSQLERLLAIAGKGPGFMAGKLTGAGSGGCVCLLVKKEKSEEMLSWLDRKYFGKEENFSEYAEVLKDLAASHDKEDQKKARELELNLKNALAHPKEQRRIVTFSQGAGLLETRFEN